MLPLADGNFVSRFTDHVVQLVESRWCSAVDGLAQWTVFKECILEVSSEWLGWSGRKQPNWFIAAANTLRPLNDKHNQLFSLWLRSGHHDDRQRYLTQRQCVAIAVRTCKNQWFQDMASSVQTALAQGNPNVVWRKQFVNVELVFSRFGLEVFVSRMVIFELVQQRLLIDGVSILRVF